MGKQVGVWGLLGFLFLASAGERGMAAPPLPFRAPAGFLGEYWTNTTVPASPGVPAGAPNLTQNDPRIDFSDNAGGVPPAPAQPMAWPATAVDNFVVRWTGYVMGPITGPVTFKTVSDDGIQLSVGGTVVISQWIDRGPNRGTPDTAVVNMTQNVWVPVEVIMYEKGGGAEARLFWDYAGAPSVDGDIAAPFADQNPPPPPAPTLSIATPQNFNPIINLSWTAVPNATSYNILRGFSTGTEVQYQTVAAPTTTYQDTGVQFGVTYFYVVRAVIGNLASANSNEVSGMPQPLPPRTGKNQRSDCGCATTHVPGWAAVAAGLATLGLLVLVARRS